MQPDATLPDDCREAFVEACARKDAELAVDFVWRKFVKHAHRKRWKLHEQLDRWVDWVDREIDWTSRQATERDTRAKTGNAIAVARARERDAERDQWERDFERNLPEARAQAQRAMAALGDLGVIVEAVTAALAVCLFGAGAIADRLRRRPSPHDRCLGYAPEKPSEPLQNDCLARQSPSCLDGRCSYHCGRMCKCSSPATFSVVEVEPAPQTARSVRR